MRERQGHLFEPPLWRAIKDGDDDARAFFDQHYSRYRYADGRDPKLFVGPGRKLVLVTPDRMALFVWRKFISGDGQQGVNCAIFRNESERSSSSLIEEADYGVCEHFWPGERRFTYVDPRKVKSGVPGYCFIQAGWQPCGITKWNKLLIFERNPACPSISHRKSIAFIDTLMANSGLTPRSSFMFSRTSEGTPTASLTQAA